MNKVFTIILISLSFVLMSCGASFDSISSSQIKSLSSTSQSYSRGIASAKLQGDLKLNVHKVGSQIEIFWNKIHGQAKYDIFVSGRLHKTVEGNVYKFSSSDSSNYLNSDFQVQGHYNGNYSDRSNKVQLNSTATNSLVPAAATPAQVTNTNDLASLTVNNLRGDVYSKSEVEVRWDRPDAHLNVKGFEVYRDGNYKTYVNLNKGTSFKDSGLNAGQEYKYKVRIQLHDQNRLLAFSNELKLRTQGESSATQASTQPTNGNQVTYLSVDVVSQNSLRVHWGQPNRGDIKGYEIYRDGGYRSYVNNGNNFIDTGLSAGQTYKYKVRYQLTNGQLLDFSSEVAATTGGNGVVLPPNPQADTTNGFPRSGNWEIEFNDEFDGPAGQEVGAPWHYDLTYDYGEKLHRGLQYNNKKHARLNGDSKLKMKIVYENGRVESSILRTANFERGDVLSKNYPSTYFLDPTSGPMYIETSVRLDKAFQTEDTWWAFWLFAPKTWDTDNNRYYDNFKNYTDTIPRLDPYDGNPNTGMEIDIFEYVPYLGNSDYESRNGFNMAVFTKNERRDSNNNIIQHSVAKHLDKQEGTEDSGFVSNFNKFLRGKGINKEINLTDGNYHKIGMYWDYDRYEFYIDGIKIWEVTDPAFISRSRGNAITLSWEYTNGLWGDRYDRKFQDQFRDVYVLIDYVKVWRLK